MRIPACLVALGLVAGLAGPASAQLALSERSELKQPALSEQSESKRPVREALLFVGGFSAGLFLHESAHMATGAALGARPRIDRLAIPLPFIVVHYDPVSRRREFAIASSGFWMQHFVSEWLLTAQPELRRTAAPFRKGLFAFGVGTSALYAVAALTITGPRERDTRSLATSLGSDGVPEPAAGALIFAPAMLDLYRYYRPGSAWARWTSRALKALSLGLVLAAGR